MSLNILCIRHADFESPGVIEEWAKDNKFNFVIKSPYQGDELLNQDSFDFLVVMGGPQSPLMIQQFPYLVDEIKLISNAMTQHKTVLGFCLGAQLIGEALGARTERSPEKEVGVYPIELNISGKKDDLFQGFPESFNVIHWHNDMPGLTENSVVLASSLGCPRQVVKYKDNVYGFQCHLEITLDGIRTMIESVPEDLAPSKFTQTENLLLVQDYESINRMMIKILNKLIKF